MYFNEFEKIVHVIQSNYKILDTAESIQIWYGFLQDLTYEQVEKAVTQHIVNETRPITIADIRKRATLKTTESTWAEGWEEVMTAVRVYGQWKVQEAIESLSPIAKKAIKRFGFVELCNTNYEDLETARAQFRQIYQAIENQAREDAVMKRETAESNQLKADERLSLK